MPVAVKIHTILANAAGQKLRIANRPGKRAGIAFHAAPLGAGKQKEVSELFAEQFAAPGMVKRQRCQRREGFKIAGVAPVIGFHADDADDDFRRHAVLLRGAFQRRPVFLIELDAVINMPRAQKTLAVGAPGTHRLALAGRGLRPRQAQHGVILFGNFQRTAHALGRKALRLHLGNKTFHLGANRQRANRRGNEAQKHGKQGNGKGVAHGQKKGGEEKAAEYTTAPFSAQTRPAWRRLRDGRKP